MEMKLEDFSFKFEYKGDEAENWEYSDLFTTISSYSELMELLDDLAKEKAISKKGISMSFGADSLSVNVGKYAFYYRTNYGELDFVAE